MSDRRRTALAVLAGATVGGVIGYVLFTDQGRRLRRRLEPAVGDVIRELGGVAGTVSTIRLLATEGRRVWNELTPEQPGRREWGAPIRQQNPF